MGKELIFFVAGGADGVGEETVRQAVRRGHKAVIADIDIDAARKLAATLGIKALAMELDVRDPQAWERAIDEAWQHMGGIDVLVNNAGVVYAGAALAQPEIEMRHMIEVNLFGTVYGVRAIMPRFEEEGVGHIVTVGNIASFLPIRRQAFYAGIKHAIRAWHYGVALENEGGPVGFTLITPSGDIDFDAHAKGTAQPIAAADDGAADPAFLARQVIDKAVQWRRARDGEGSFLGGLLRRIGLGGDDRRTGGRPGRPQRRF